MNRNPRFSDIEELLDFPALGHCTRCRRQTWSPSEVDTLCEITQPDGDPCGGWILPNA